MERRTYTDEDKAFALAAYEIQRKNLDRTAKYCKVPRNTLRRWINEDEAATAVAATAVATVATAEMVSVERETGQIPVSDGQLGTPLRQLKKEVREALADRMETMIHKLIDNIPLAILDAGLKEIATAIGILTDKRQLLLASAGAQGAQGAADDPTIHLPPDAVQARIADLEQRDRQSESGTHAEHAERS